MFRTEQLSRTAVVPSWPVLVVLCVAQLMTVLDATVVNVALPSISRALTFGPGQAQWVVTVYLLCTGGMMLLAGRAADRFGRRRVLLAGTVLFALASLASGLAPTTAVLIVARGAQGAGAALLSPAALSIITTTYTGARRTAALSAWGAINAGGFVAGLLVGGVITTELGWQWIFFVNVPVGAAVVALVPLLVSGAGVGRGAGVPGAGVPGGVAAAVGAAPHGGPAHGSAAGGAGSRGVAVDADTVGAGSAAGGHGAGPRVSAPGGSAPGAPGAVGGGAAAPGHANGTPHGSARPGAGAPPRLPVAAAVALTAGLVAVVYGVGAPHGWGSARTLGALGLGVLLLAGFAALDRRSDHPMLARALLRTRSLVTGSLLMLATTGLLGGTLFVTTFFLQAHASALRTGLDYVPFALTIGLTAHAGPHLLRHLGSRTVAATGLAAIAGGALLLAATAGHGTYAATLLPSFLLLGAGTGLALVGASVTALADVPADHAGAASGLLMTGHEAGGALGVAVLSTIATSAGGAAVGGAARIAAGHHTAFLAVAVIAAVLAVLAAVTLPVVRPPAGAGAHLH